jgi:fructose-1-phosphate kinase PfkB-like protein
VSFACCKVQAGDLVTVDNSGTLTPNAYVWFAARPDMTTLSHTSNGDSQNAGMVWAPLPHPGYEVLLQVVMQPS